MTRTQSQAAAALLLAFAGGAVDAASYLVLHKTFTANMTGNSTQLGIGGGRASAAVVIPLAAAVSTFVIAIALATAGIELAARRGRRSTAAPVLLVEAVLLAAFAIVGRHVLRHGAAPDHAAGFYAMLIIAVVAMGIQTAALTRALGATVRTTYVSGVLTTLSQHAVNWLLPATGGRPSYLRDDLQLGSRRESRIRMAFQLGVWASFVTGALWGGYGTHRWWTWTLLLPLAAVLGAIGVDLRRPVHACATGSDHPSK